MKKNCFVEKIVLFLILLLSISFFVIPGMTIAQEDVGKHLACVYCGMDRAKFAHSRVYVEYDDDTTVGTCSLHCAAIDMALKIDKTPKSIMVGDYSSKRLIDTEKAFWVIGGSKVGVMTTRAKWAFEKKEDANQFVKEFGGELAAFDDAVQAAFEDMHKDLKMIREKRKMKRMKE